MEDVGEPYDAALKEGFREPPDHVTVQCLTYMARTMELRDFVAFYFNFVKTSESLRDIIPEDRQKSLTPEQMTVLTYDYSAQRPLVNQIMLSRAIESFDLYLTTILTDIFLSRPEMLKSEGSLEVSSIIEAGNYEEIVWKIVERKVHELSYKPLSDLRKYISSRTGIDLFPSDEAYQMTLVASEIRNLVAHNDCVMNPLFERRTRGTQIRIQTSDTGRILIDDVWLRKASYTLDGIVFRFDELAASKFGLHTLFRMGAFILRS